MTMRDMIRHWLNPWTIAEGVGLSIFVGCALLLAKGIGG